MKAITTLKETVAGTRKLLKRFSRNVRGEVQYRRKRVRKFWRRDSQRRLLVYVAIVSIILWAVVPYAFTEEEGKGLAYFAWMGFFWTVLISVIKYLVLPFYQRMVREFALKRRVEKTAAGMVVVSAACMFCPAFYGIVWLILPDPFGAIKAGSQVTVFIAAWGSLLIPVALILWITRSIGHWIKKRCLRWHTMKTGRVNPYSWIWT